MTSPLDLSNIQGDILSGLPKKTQIYAFFRITDIPLFRKQLRIFQELIKTVEQVIADRKAIEDHKREHKKGLIPMVGVNIGFSSKGLTKLGIADDVHDVAFTEGQRQDAQALGDNGTSDGTTFTPDWDASFLEDIDLLIFLAGDSHGTLNKKSVEIDALFGLGTPDSSLREVTRIRGDVRPGKASGHEHFGFLDGVSNPAVRGFDTTPLPGQEFVRQGIILCGRDGDPFAAKRPSWMIDGCFLTFRLLAQKVPEFDKFLEENPILQDDLTPEQGSELLGARLVGRWKSGAPIDLTPLADNPAIGGDPQRNNDFRFKGEVSDQSRCPFAAHVRKVNPRADLEDNNASTESHRIIRRGVAYGPEVTEAERCEGKTQYDRGLLFTCYSSSVDNGFHFVQKSWANNPRFQPFQKTPATPGIDPIIGQVGNGAPRSMSGTNPDDLVAELSMSQFVIPRGGENFFVPSLGPNGSVFF